MASLENTINPYLVVAYPELDGWVVTLEQKLDALLSDYLTSNYDQSTIFNGNIVSHGYTLAHYGKDPTRCCMEVEDDLRKLLGRYFKRYEVTVTHQDDESQPYGSRYNIIMKIGISDGENRKAETINLLEISSQKLTRLFRLNNNQEVIYEKRYDRFEL